MGCPQRGRKQPEHRQSAVTEDYSLDLSGAVQLDWTVQQMEQQTETEYLLDAENIPDED